MGVAAGRERSGGERSSGGDRGGRDRRGDGELVADGRRSRARRTVDAVDQPARDQRPVEARGQEVLVQIAKEPIAKKGARITSHIALPGRFLVFMPTVNHTGRVAQD